MTHSHQKESASDMNMIASGSATLFVAEEARRLKATGKDVIHLAGGTPAFDLPAGVKAEIRSALAEGPMSPTDSRGLYSLREALSEELRSDKGLRADPGEIVVTVGGKEAVMAALLALIAPGDEVLLPDPAWVTYEPWIRRAGGVPVTFTMGSSNKFRPNWDEVTNCLSARTKLVLLTTPHNPTGTVLRRNELLRLGEILAKHHALVLSDESNSKIIYDNIEHVSPVQVSALAERTILINSFSKNLSMGGWRLGYVWARCPHINAIMAVHQHAVSCVPLLVQKAGLALLRSPERATLVGSMVRAYHEQRIVLVDGLNDIPGIRCHYPEGAYNAYPDFSSFELPSEELAHRLLIQAGVSSVPGDAFGMQGAGHLRMAFTLPPVLLNEAVDRIRHFCGSLAADNGTSSIRN